MRYSSSWIVFYYTLASPKRNTENKKEQQVSDRYPAQILIGGQVSRTTLSKTDPDETVLDVLLGMIATAQVSDEYGGASVEPDEATLMELVDENGWLRLRDEQAVNGEIPDLEELCHTEGIPFSRSCCCYGGYLGENVTWLPGMAEPLTILETDDGHEQVDGSEVRRALEMFHRYFNPYNEVVCLSALKDQALSILEGLCPTVPEVPKFEVIP